MNMYEKPINPSNWDDQKFYISTIKEENTDEELVVKQENANELVEMRLHDRACFDWSRLIHKIRIYEGKLLLILQETRKLDGGVNSCTTG